MVVAVVAYGHRTRNSSTLCTLVSGRETVFFVIRSHGVVAGGALLD